MGPMARTYGGPVKGCIYMCVYVRMCVCVHVFVFESSVIY